MEQRAEQNSQSDSLYKIIPVKPEFLQRARGMGVDDQAQLVERLIASGGEPCRDSLYRAKAGEELILASYCPFEIAGPYKEYGPIFILANELDHSAISSSSSVSSDVAGLIENHYLGEQFVLRAYSAQERIVDACLSSPALVESDLHRLFMLDEVKFVLVRFAAYGCYACRIERAI